MSERESKDVNMESVLREYSEWFSQRVSNAQEGESISIQEAREISVHYASLRFANSEVNASVEEDWGHESAFASDAYDWKEALVRVDQGDWLQLKRMFDIEAHSLLDRPDIKNKEFGSALMWISTLLDISPSSQSTTSTPIQNAM